MTDSINVPQNVEFCFPLISTFLVDVCSGDLVAYKGELWCSCCVNCDLPDRKDGGGDV